jgi:hypothetical protein
MSTPGDYGRRVVIRTLGAAIAALSLPPALQAGSPADVLEDLPGSLSLIGLRRSVLSAAARRQRMAPIGRHQYQAAQALLTGPADPRVRDAFTRQVRADFWAGQVALIEGWVLADTEVALLALAAER